MLFQQNIGKPKTAPYSWNFNSDNCSSMEQSTWQEVRQVEGMRMRPRHRCSIGEGEERLVLRYSTASWRMMFPCLSIQWKVPRKNRPSLIPTSIRWNRSFLARDTRPEQLGLDLSEVPVRIKDASVSISMSMYLNWSLLMWRGKKDILKWDICVKAKCINWKTTTFGLCNESQNSLPLLQGSAFSFGHFRIEIDWWMLSQLH